MATARDTPNPLRPYYIPPSIGLPPDPSPNSTTTSVAAAHTKITPSASPPKPSFGSQARDILSDLDYGVDLSLGDGSPSLAEMAKKLLDQAVWNYTSVLFAQPFEVAKTILQCHLAGSNIEAAKLSAVSQDGRRTAASSRYNEHYTSEESDSDADGPSYFSSTAPQDPYTQPSRPHSRNRRTPSRSASSTPTPAHPPSRYPYKLDLKRPDSLLEVLSQLWTKEGAWGIWKGTNSTFVYNFLLKTIETWLRSLLSALLNVPDPGLLGGYGVGGGGLDVVDSPNPFMSLTVAVAAAGITGLFLAPLDIVRTRLILTPITTSPRNMLPSLRSLPSLTLPAPLLPITLLHSTLPTLLSASAPLLLRSTLRIDPVLTPATYSLSTFFCSAAELFCKLPLETVLRRGHANFLTMHALTAEEPLPTVVDVGPYRGVLGSMWFIAREEGESAVVPVSAVAARAGARSGQTQRTKKGQGVHGLWRGWRVGFWGLVGVWGAAALGGGGGGEF
ncbi:mitochondrial carrier [Saccharata proteae CBS 121410]|uniref:Mitochondrial carrier n=1 Tax=Saccharata proteae CBS 121410 TaxID=1314787 RepID=A0A9P4HPK8_9PEZI|nr:mitochondrial carrier [Saccharata proteae CBS 121410]